MIRPANNTAMSELLPLRCSQANSLSISWILGKWVRGAQFWNQNGRRWLTNKKKEVDTCFLCWIVLFQQYWHETI
jgi:hypothetical protein